MYFPQPKHSLVVAFMQKFTVKEITGTYCGGGDSGNMEGVNIVTAVYTMEQLSSIKTVPLENYFKAGTLQEYHAACEEFMKLSMDSREYNQAHTVQDVVNGLLYDIVSEYIEYDITNGDGGMADILLRADGCFTVDGCWYEQTSNDFTIDDCGEGPPDAEDA